MECLPKQFLNPLYATHEISRLEAFASLPEFIWCFRSMKENSAAIFKVIANHSLLRQQELYVIEKIY
jgi:hypothetical protein